LTIGVVQLNGAVDGQGRPAEHVLRDAYLNATFQSGLPSVLDDAIVAYAKALGFSPPPATKIGEIPYDFVRKRLSVLIQAGGERRLITKGALENVLAVCTRLQEGDRVLALDDAQLAQLRQRFVTWSTQGYRVLGVAAKSLTTNTHLSHADESELCFTGF
ncbi:MAG TPA: hypothetical protein PKE45_02465, partial [Caldilineaceae bacterium]|nr:hypothetical protein [Caldilineaceae bacterium]